jgi:hypothetical protein
METGIEISNLFKELDSINRIYDNFIYKGKAIIDYFYRAFDEVKIKPIEFKKDNEGDIKFVFLKKSFEISIIAPVVVKELEKDKNTRGKLVTYLIIDIEKAEKKIIDELTFNFDYNGSTYKDGIEYNDIEFLYKYLLEFKNYILNSKSSFIFDFA